MSETWAKVVVESGGVSLTTRVGGTPLALRHARMVSRATWHGIVFVIPDRQEREKVAALFERSPSPRGLALKFASTDEWAESPTHIVLLGSALYTCDTLRTAGNTGTARVAPDFVIQSRKDLGHAQRFLFAQIRKSVVLDGVIAYYLMRPLARIFTRLLINTPISPNQATLSALACGIAAAIYASLGGAQFAIYAGAFYWFGGVLDCIDGDLARLRLQSSKAGEWLDSMVDEFSTIALITGLGVGLTREGHGDHWMLMAIGGSIVAILTLAPMYADLHRQKLAIDTAQFPWFFGSESSEVADRPEGVIGKLVTYASYFVRRDANITFTSLLLILNLRAVSLIIMLGAYAIASLLLITHYSVMRTRQG